MLRGLRRDMDLAHDIHAAHDLSERRETAMVLRARPAVVETRLFADADKEIRLRRIERRIARHRHRSVAVPNTGLAGRLEDDRRVEMRMGFRIVCRLDHVDLRVFVRLIVGMRRDGPEKRAAVEETPPDGPLDLLLRREQADAVFRLAAAGQQAERAGCREG